VHVCDSNSDKIQWRYGNLSTLTGSISYALLDLANVSRLNHLNIITLLTQGNPSPGMIFVWEISKWAQPLTQLYWVK